MTQPTIADEWAKHSLAHWSSIAGNPAAHGPTRVAAYAMANPKGNGHVSISDPDLAKALVDKNTGDTPSPRTVEKWRASAVKEGLLHPDTWGRCLVLPHGVRTEVVARGSRFAECLTCKYRTGSQGAVPRDQRSTLA